MINWDLLRVRAIQWTDRKQSIAALNNDQWLLWLFSNEMEYLPSIVRCNQYMWVLNER